MGKRVYKTYVNLTNIIIRISDGTPAGKEHAILVNAHLDSTLPSPGAADDGLAVGVMLDVMRVLINTPDWSPKHPIILCKSIYSIFDSTLLKCLQYLTMRKSRFKTVRIYFPRSTQLHQRVSFSEISLKPYLTEPSVRAVINLEGVYLAIPWEPTTDVTEAAGSTGRELLFQATSEQMIDAYSRVPRCLMSSCIPMLLVLISS